MRVGEGWAQSILFLCLELVDDIFNRSQRIFALVVELYLFGELVSKIEYIVEVTHGVYVTTVFEDIIEEGIIFSNVELKVDENFVAFYLFIRDLEDSTELEFSLIDAVLCEYNIIGELHFSLKSSICFS